MAKTRKKSPRKAKSVKRVKYTTKRIKTHKSPKKTVEKLYFKGKLKKRKKSKSILDEIISIF